MRVKCLRLAACLAFAVAVPLHPLEAQPAAARTEAATESVDRAALFDTVVARIAARYWDPDHLVREKWSERAAAARRGVIEAPSTDETVARINVLIDSMKASHFRLHSPDELGWYVLLDLSPSAPGARDLILRRFWGNRPYYAGIGAFTVEIDGKHFVDGVMEGSPAAFADIRVGDEIVEVDGAPYHLIRSFRSKSGETARVGIRRRVGGPTETVTVAVTPIVPGIAFDQATRTSAHIIERGGKRIGYFHVWALFSDAPILQAMARLSPGGRLRTNERSEDGRAGPTVIMSEVGAVTNEPLDGIIVDMRGKVGGRDFSDTLLNLLDRGRAGAPFFFKGRPGRDGQPPRPEPRNPSFRGRAVLLTDHHTRSAGEMISHSFRAAGLGLIVGTTTVGHVLAAGIEVMPGGYVLQVPNSRPEVDGQFLEGKGVVPDIVVERPLPYSGGVDPVLEAGLDKLIERLRR